MHIGLTGWQRDAAEGDHRELLAREVGTGHLRCVFNALGGLDRATTVGQMELFGQEMLPACRDVERPHPRPRSCEERGDE